MTLTLPSTEVHVPLLTRLTIRLLVRVAGALSKRKPAAIQRFLGTLSRGARAGDYAAVSRARDEILTVSAACRGSAACLPRSLSVVLLCRLRGLWADWCVGVLVEPPFMAHAWVEAEGLIVDEPLEHDELKTLFRVSAASKPV